MQVSALAGLSGLGDLAPRPQSLWTHETAGVESLRIVEWGEETIAALIQTR